jgi:hypothetical protein
LKDQAGFFDEMQRKKAVLIHKQNENVNKIIEKNFLVSKKNF